MRQKIFVWLMAAGVLMWLPAGCIWTPLEPVAATVESYAADAQVTINRAGARTVVEVHSPSGIGRSRIRLPETLPPGPLEFRLHLAGLEHFSLAYADTVIAVRAPQGGYTPVITARAAGEPETPIAPDSPYWMDVYPPASNRDDPVYRVVASPHLLNQQPQELELSWVDFYR